MDQVSAAKCCDSQNSDKVGLGRENTGSGPCECLQESQSQSRRDKSRELIRQTARPGHFSVTNSELEVIGRAKDSLVDWCLFG